jgi:hypothetical protein
LEGLIRPARQARRPAQARLLAATQGHLKASETKGRAGLRAGQGWAQAQGEQDVLVLSEEHCKVMVQLQLLAQAVKAGLQVRPRLGARQRQQRIFQRAQQRPGLLLAGAFHPIFDHHCLGAHGLQAGEPAQQLLAP